METATETKTFHEVHQEIENEFMFLQEKHDYKDFRLKAEFLKRIGFENSIATKLYSSVAASQTIISEFNRVYKDQYKLLLEPQLERVCEKYDLYVRQPQFFVGDIPEKNVKDLMNFKIRISDLPYSYDNEKIFLQAYHKFVEDNNKNGYSPKINIISDEYYSNREIFIPFSQFSDMRITSFIEIAAVKSLFSKEAFETSDERIISVREVAPKGKVVLDPIILCKCKQGRIIVTAWGEEANDELIANPKNN